MHSIYRQEILDHYNNPQNFGKIKSFNAYAMGSNPFCGDKMEIFLKISKGLILDISFMGKGCAISIASASILTEFVKGKTKKELTKLSENDMLSLLGINISETRKKCALLALKTLNNAL